MPEEIALDAADATAASGGAALRGLRRPGLSRLLMAGVLGAGFLWAYWPTLVELVRAWDRQPDYSHGFLVVPFAAYLLWFRRDRFPGRAQGVAWPGLLLIALSMVVRFVGGRYYLGALDGWSIPLWLAGVIWFLGGWRVARWSLPAVAFLWFMVPLPFSVERGLSVPLQHVATRISCWALQTLGQPALAQGHTILLENNRLEVEQACSGLRIFMGIIALAFAYLVVMRQTWWERIILLLSIVPIALIANASRIVVTAWLYVHASGEAAKKFSHDAAGWVMIVFAAGLFALVVYYVKHLFREEQSMDVADILRRP
jgi:exosortase